MNSWTWFASPRNSFCYFCLIFVLRNKKALINYFCPIMISFCFLTTSIILSSTSVFRTSYNEMSNYVAQETPPMEVYLCLLFWCRCAIISLFLVFGDFAHYTIIAQFCLGSSICMIIIFCWFNSNYSAFT